MASAGKTILPPSINHFLMKRSWIVPLLLFCCLFIAKPCLSGQIKPIERDSLEIRKEAFAAFYPILFYFPETRLGFGVATIYNYYPGLKASSRPSQWQVGGAYTLNKQILMYGFYQYFLHQNRTEIFGEIGYYDYFYFYYGIGNDTRFGEEETYSVRFPRFRLHLLKQVAPDWRAGLSYKFDYYNIYAFEEHGHLEQGTETGTEGGIISTIGAMLRYDSRDDINLPRMGSLVTFSLEHNGHQLGSQYSFQRFSVDVIKYIPIGEQKVLALNLFSGRMYGDPPFQELLLLGGAKRGRGIVEGRYRDYNLLLFQGEFRFPLLGRFRGSVFTSYGRVSQEYRHLLHGGYHINYGAGVRFLLDPDERIQLRFDLGLGSNEPGYYLTVGEAF